MKKFFLFDLIDFDGMSTRQRLFYALRLGNRFHCTFTFLFALTFLCCFFRVFILFLTIYQIFRDCFLKISLYGIDHD